MLPIDRSETKSGYIFLCSSIFLPRRANEGISFTRGGELNCLSPWTRALQGLLVRCASIIRSASELDVRSWKGRERMEIRDNGSRRNRAARGETNSIDTR